MENYHNDLTREKQIKLMFEFSFNSENIYHVQYFLQYFFYFMEMFY